MNYADEHHKREDEQVSTQSDDTTAMQPLSYNLQPSFSYLATSLKNQRGDTVFNRTRSSFFRPIEKHGAATSTNTHTHITYTHAYTHSHTRIHREKSKKFFLRREDVTT